MGSSPPPARPLAPGAAEGFQGVEDAGQAFFPGAFALEAGLDGRQGQRGRAGGEQLGDGAHLLGQSGGPGLGRGGRRGAPGWAVASSAGTSGTWEAGGASLSAIFMPKSGCSQRGMVARRS